MSSFSSTKTWTDEPKPILDLFDAIPETQLENALPSYRMFLSQKPKQLFPLIKSGIEADELETVNKIRGFTYNKLHYNDIWNNIAMRYEFLKQYEKAKEIFKVMLARGASDSATLNNYAAVLMNELINKGKIEERDEAQFYEARDYVYKAFIFDAEGKPKKILHASDAPAYRNIIIFRNIESELYYNKKEYFTSFVLGWISIEMNLNRIWCKHLNVLSEDDALKEKLLRYNADEMIDQIYLHGIINKELRDELNKYRSLRNDLVHGTEVDVTPGDVMNVITLGRRLYPILA